MEGGGRGMKKISVVLRTRPRRPHLEKRNTNTNTDLNDKEKSGK